ncbi:Periplasmic thiol:disulfide interchange protein DsbA [Rhodovulum sp. P5]|uniref:DsbA family protein n=1 Tax=Rhodovulum sp. P5 TaxID=1564506 RepID=UPI0009C1A932|nr:DsbA family protein [Rhodovulum sp. P5]ARE41420.1 Periplasmic thiol:disulfide interchange protein DsbA [Rhodovulum sp. P5]
MIRNMRLGLIALGILGGAWLATSHVLPGLSPVGPAQAQDSAADTVVVTPFTLGDPDAPIKISEYASFTCGHCGHFHEEVFKKLKADYIDTGKVYFTYQEVYWDPYAIWAGLLARCGGEMRFFGIVSMLYEKQGEWIDAKDPGKTAENLRKIGRTAGLGADEMEQCLSDAALATALRDRSDKVSARDGITGTPSLMIDGELYKNMPYRKLKQILDDKLKG